MVVAIIAAILVSALGLIPFRVAIKRIKLVDQTAPLAMLGPFMLTVALSFIILLAGIVACKLLAEDLVLVYSFTELIAFTVGVFAMGMLARQHLK